MDWDVRLRSESPQYQAHQLALCPLVLQGLRRAERRAARTPRVRVRVRARVRVMDT